MAVEGDSAAARSLNQGRVAKSFPRNVKAATALWTFLFERASHFVRNSCLYHVVEEVATSSVLFMSATCFGSIQKSSEVYAQVRNSALAFPPRKRWSRSAVCRAPWLLGRSMDHVFHPMLPLVQTLNVNS